MKFCMNCMEHGDEFTVCPRCGYYVGKEPLDPAQLEPGYILADRYIVGVSLNVERDHISYMGWDALSEKKVKVQEFFSVGCSRHPNSGYVVDQSADRSLFDNKKRWLAEIAGKLTEVGGLQYVESINSVLECNNTVYLISDYFETAELSSMIGSMAKLPIKKVKKLFLPMLKELDKLHELGYVIGGISEKNIRITKMSILTLSEHVWSKLKNEQDKGFHSEENDSDSYVYPIESFDRQLDNVGVVTDVYSMAALIYKWSTGNNIDLAAKRKASFEKRQKDTVASPHKLLKSKDEYNKIFSVAVMNALNIYPDYRTPDMEKFIEELTMDKPAKRRVQFKKKIPLWAKVMIPAASVGAVVAVVLLVIGCNTKINPPDNTIKLPDVTGMRLEDARAAMEKEGLHIAVIEGEYGKAEEGKVVSQSIPADTLLEKSTTIILVVGSGESTAQ